MRGPAARPAQQVRIILKHHNDPEGRFTPQWVTCSDDPEKGRKGCGGSIVFYRTYPREARMPFDGEPHVIDQCMLENGMIVATVDTDKVHFATCTARHRGPASTVDFKQAAGGEQR